MSALAILKDAWANREKLGDGNHTRELAAFLPAALEIQQAPANPAAKWLGRSLMALFLLGVLWACAGKVNIVASAEGKIIPGSRVKQIQPLQKSVVKSILVKEGQYVKKGQALIELDSTLTFADEKRLTGELQSAQLKLAVSQALLGLLGIPNKKKSPMTASELALTGVAAASEAEVTLHKRHLWYQWQQHLAQLQVLKSTLVRTTAEKAATREVIIKLQQTLPIINKRTATMKDLYDKRYASETDYLQLEQERIEQQQDLAAEKHRFNQLVAGEVEVAQQIKAMDAQASAAQLTVITETQRQIAALKEELTKASNTNARQVLYSPVSGQVQSLEVNTVGGVVTDAQQLMLIVPDEEQLEVEVFLNNKDIGFVRKGMAAEIKIHTFPFTKYGVIDGEITTISDDATVDEQRGLIYGMHLLMDKSTIMVNGKEVKLMPGMAVTAEVQTGERRIIEFFMAPLLRYKSESIRER
ncbi:MAG: HlyD family type I secretion periplasmic adaptor subunit [Colwellia sp.]|jgi:type I secretion membrane fusion protein, HlyD family